MSINLLNNCISELLKNQDSNEINIEPIYHYLESFKSFMFLLKNQNSLSIEKILTEISRCLKLRKITKNELIFQQGELGDKFYIILKGNLKVLKLIPHEFYMTNEEYIRYLLDLRINNQNEIIRQCKHYNNLVYPIPENFDAFVKNLVNKTAGGIYLDMHNLIEKAEEVINYINEEKIMNKINIANLSPEDYIRKFKVSNCIINNTEIISNFINEKMNMNDIKEIDEIKLLMKDRKKVIIPCYEIFIELNTGNTLGEQAFESHDRLYKSTVIAIDDEGYLGYIKKKKYNSLMHESIEKRNKKIFGLLVYFSLMNLNNIFSFEKKYLGYINDKVFSSNYELFREGEECENTFFITEGEYELSMNKNIIEVNEMIIEYKKLLKKLNNSNKNKYIYDYEEENKQNNDLILNSKFRADSINELIMKKKYIKINILHKKDILGLSDVFIFDSKDIETNKELLIYKPLKKKCLLTCKCLNSNCHAFYLPNSIFNNLYYNEEKYNIIANFEFKKICSIIERLNIYKKSVFDLVKKEQNKFSKRIKILKEISKIPKFIKSGYNNNIKTYNNIITEIKDSKEQSGKASEKNNRNVRTLKHNFNLSLLNSNKHDNYNNSNFPSIILNGRNYYNNSISKSNSKIKLKKRNKTNKNERNALYTHSKTNNSSDLNNIFIQNFLYENLFYNYTINDKKKQANKNKISFIKTFNYNNSKALNERYNSDNKNNDIENLDKNISKSQKIPNIKIAYGKKGLIGGYDPLAFDKFNKLFSFHFNRHLKE